MKKIFVLFVIAGFYLTPYAQQSKQQFKIAIVSFYNLENLFDTLDDPAVIDEEFIPTGPKNYTGSIYFDKLSKLAKVISEIGTDQSPDGPALLGISEVENISVLNDLVQQPPIHNRDYHIVHYDSKDARGIDVALLYNPKYFQVEASDKLFVQLPGGSKDAYYTRDILWVRGMFDGEVINIYVNHWPSRRGGEERSAPAREAAAQVCRNHMDAILKTEPDAKFIVMGDLNDDPINTSVTKIINATGKERNVKRGGMFNPWTDLYKKGIGTIAYRDAWGLFDQILISHSWLSKDQPGFFYFQQHIYKKEYMIENIGNYKGYPMRTWDGNRYRGGYSDHLPTYLVFLKRIPTDTKGF